MRRFSIIVMFFVLFSLPSDAMRRVCSRLGPAGHSVESVGVQNLGHSVLTSENPAIISSLEFSPTNIEHAYARAASKMHAEYVVRSLLPLNPEYVLSVLSKQNAQVLNMIACNNAFSLEIRQKAQEILKHRFDK